MNSSRAVLIHTCIHVCIGTIAVLIYIHVLYMNAYTYTRKQRNDVYDFKDSLNCMKGI